MKRVIDKQRIAALIRQLIIELGDDPDREGLIDTPRRVANMYKEVFEGMRYTNDDIADMFNKTFEISTSRDLVVVKDIEVFSYCEHHLALMYNMRVHIGYIPNGRVIGLSKLARIADMAAKRLQIQERIGSDIAYIVQNVVGTEDVIVVIDAQHSCMTARGVRNASSQTRTAALRGIFESDYPLRQEVYSLIKS